MFSKALSVNTDRTEQQKRGFIRMKCKDVIELSINRLNLNGASRLSVKERSGRKHVFMLKKLSNNKIFFFQRIINIQQEN